MCYKATASPYSWTYHTRGTPYIFTRFFFSAAHTCYSEACAYAVFLYSLLLYPNVLAPPAWKPLHGLLEPLVGRASLPRLNSCFQLISDPEITSSQGCFFFVLLHSTGDNHWGPGPAIPMRDQMSTSGMTCQNVGRTRSDSL